jgi:predicted AlkP superfamily pyrophosphatase or phosphodiesterase
LHVDDKGFFMKLLPIILGFIVCFAQLWGEDITVTPQTFTGTQKVGTVTTENIVTQGTVTVVNGANITFGANNSITLKPGFTAGNYFRAYIDTSVYISFAAPTSSVAENGGSISIPITLSRAATEPITINYAAISGTATANGDDYALSAGALNIPAGTTAGNITVTINDDAVYEGDETVVINLNNPVGGILGANTAHTLTINDNDPTLTSPVITTHPANVTVNAGSNATFNVIATGTAPLTYQWSLSTNGGATWTPINQGNGPSFILLTASMTDSGSQFRVVVSNSVGSETSVNATLTVQSVTAPTITRQPENQTVHAGQSATFTVEGTGSPALAYQWFKDGVMVSGATSVSYTTQATVPTDNGAQFSVTVSNLAGSVTSSTATLSVHSLPNIISQPTTQSVYLGQPATFTVVASEIPAVTYQWYKNGIIVSEATSASYTTPAASLSDNGTRFSVVVTNVVGSVTSRPATWLVNATTPTSLVITPATVQVGRMGMQKFSATIFDQFGQPMTLVPSVSWSVSGGGSITLDGIFTARNVGGGPHTVTARVNDVSGTAQITINAHGPSIAEQADAEAEIYETTTPLSVLGADSNGEEHLLYIWSATGPSSVAFSDNNNNSAKNCVAAFTQAGQYSFEVTVQNEEGLTVTSMVNVVVKQTVSSLAILPTSAAVKVGLSQQFSVTATDQFDQVMLPPDSIYWSVDDGGIIDTKTGLFLADIATGGPYTVTAYANSYNDITATATVTLVEQPNGLPTVKIERETATISEPDGASGVFTLTRSGSTDETLTVWLSRDGSTATVNNDYITSVTNESPQIEFQPGSSVATITVSAVGDALLEGKEFINVSILPQPAIYHLAEDAFAQITITDATVSLQANTQNIREGIEKNHEITITRTGSTAAEVRIPLVFSGTAQVSNDYFWSSQQNFSNGYITLPSGYSSASIRLYPRIDNDTFEGNKTLTVTIPRDGSLPQYAITSNQVDIVIEEDDEQLSWNIINPSATESSEVARGRLTIFGDNLSDGTQIYFLNDTALLLTIECDSDGVVTPGALAVTIGADRATTLTNLKAAIEASTLGLQATISDEQHVNLTAITSGENYNYNLDVGHVDVNKEAEISVDGMSGGATTISAVLEITRSTESSSPLSVTLDLSGNATSDDFTTQPNLSPGRNTITFAPEQLTQTIKLTPINDAISESRETVLFTIVPSPTTYAVPGTPSVTVTISDNDLPSIRIAASSTVAVEGGTVAELVVTRDSGDDNRPLTVPLLVTGNATPGVDYRALPNDISFAAGETRKTLFVSALSDDRIDPQETVQVELLGGETYSVNSLANKVAVTIADATQVRVTAALISHAAEGGATGVIRVTRTGGLGSPLSVPVSLGGNAQLGHDYTWSSPDTTLNFSAGQTVTDLPFNPVDDNESEGDETITVTLLPGSYVIDGPHTTTVLLHDNEKPSISLIATDADARESGLQTATLTVARSVATNSAIIIPLQVSGTATTSDVEEFPRFVTIPADKLSTTLTVTPRDDADQEMVETVVVTLLPGDGYALTDKNSAQINLFSDDLPAPIISYFTATNVQVDATGAVPSGFDIESIEATFTNPTIHATTSISNGGFLVRATVPQPGLLTTTVTLRFRDVRGVLGSPSEHTLSWSPNSSGNSGGNPAATPLPAPTLTLTVQAGSLTGDKTGMLDGKETKFSKNDSIVIQASAQAYAGSSITRIEVTASDGQTKEATGGSATFEFPEDGIYTFSATAVATRPVNGSEQSASVAITDKERILVDRTPPVLTMVADPKFWRSPEEPFIIPDNRNKIHGADKDYDPLNLHMIYLNGSDDEVNKSLRDPGGFYFPKASFAVRIDVTDASGGLSAQEAEPTAEVKKLEDPMRDSIIYDYKAILQPRKDQVNLTVEATRGEDDVITRLALTGFSELDDNYYYIYRYHDDYDHECHVREDVEQHHVSVSHNMLNLSSVSDRCGNTIEKDDLVVMTSHSSPNFQSKSEVLFGRRSPVRTAEFQPQYYPDELFLYYSGSRMYHALVAGWHDDALSGLSLRPHESYWYIGDENWRLATPVDLYSGSGQSSFIVQDMWGNRSTTQLNVQEPDYTYSTDWGYYDREDYYNGYEADKLTYSFIDIWIDDTQTTSFPSSRFKYQVTYSDLYFDPCFGEHTQWGTPFKEHPVFTVTIPTAGLWYLNPGLTRNNDYASSYDDKFPIYSPIVARPLYVGDGPKRHCQPGIINLPPSWETQPREQQIHICDDGFKKLARAGRGEIDLSGSKKWAVDNDAKVTRFNTDTIAKTLLLTRPRDTIPARYIGDTSLEYYWEETYTEDELRYGNFPGRGWLNVMDIQDDVVASGTRATISIRGNFLDTKFDPADFSRAGDYVHFLLKDADITIPYDQRESITDPEQRAKKIIITNQRLIAVGQYQAKNQILQLDLDIGPEVESGLYDVDIKLGAVKAFSDKLSQQYNGVDGAHRMKQALAVVKIGLEDQDKKEVGALASVSDPHPVVTLDDISSGSVKKLPSGLLEVSVTGYIHDALADITPGGAADIRDIDIAGNTVSVSKVDDDREEDERIRPYAWRGKFTTKVVMPVTNVFDIVAKATNALGNSGYDSASVKMTYDTKIHGTSNPGGGSPAVQLIPGCRLPDGLITTREDTLALIDCFTGVEMGGGVETEPAARLFPGLLLSRSVIVTIDSEPASLSATEKDRLMMRISGPALETEAVIPLLETDNDSREFRPDASRADETVPVKFPGIPGSPDGETEFDTTVTITSITVDNKPGTDEGLVAPLVVTVAQPETGSKPLVPWEDLKIDGTTLEVIEDSDAQHRRAKLPLLLVKRPVPATLTGNGNIIEAKSLKGALQWSDDHGRLIGMAWVAADPKDVARYGKGLEWPCIIKGINLRAPLLGNSLVPTNADQWTARIKTPNGGIELKDMTTTYRKRSISLTGRTQFIYDMDFTGSLNAKNSSEGTYSVEILHDDKLIGTSVDQIEIIPTRVVLFCIDGLGAHWFGEAGKNAPELRSIMGEGKGTGINATFSKAIFRTGASALPSITWCNWASVMTGKDPKVHGVYGNSFFRRDMPAERPIFSGNDENFTGETTTLISAATFGLNQYLKPGVQTIFEAMKFVHSDKTTASIFTWYGRGADGERTYTCSLAKRHGKKLVMGAGLSYLFSGPSGAITGAANSAIKAYNEAQMLKGHAEDGSTAEFVDRFSLDFTLEEWSGENPPHFTAIYLPGPDNFGHSAGEELYSGSGSHDTETGNWKPFKHFLGHTDEQIGRLRKRIAELGMQNAVVYVFTSDHGQTVTDHPLPSAGGDPETANEHDLHLRWEQEANRQIISLVDAIPGLEERTFLAANHGNHNQQAVIYSPNGGMAYFYARDPGQEVLTGNSQWSAPHNETIRDIAVQLWKASHDNGFAAGLGYPQFQGALGKDPVVLVRQTGAFLDMNGNPYSNSYEIMALTNILILPDKTLVELSSLEAVASRHSDWTDFPRRIRALDDKIGNTPSGTRCGDIIIIPDTKAGYNAVHEGDAYPGWHGGPSKADSRVPLAIASEALSIDGANQVLRDVIDASMTSRAGVHQNQDTTRMILKIFQEVK